jgi:hypothetical protein
MPSFIPSLSAGRRMHQRTQCNHARKTRSGYVPVHLLACMTGRSVISVPNDHPAVKVSRVVTSAIRLMSASVPPMASEVPSLRRWRCPPGTVVNDIRQVRDRWGRDVRDVAGAAGTRSERVEAHGVARGQPYDLDTGGTLASRDERATGRCSIPVARASRRRRPDHRCPGGDGGLAGVGHRNGSRNEHRGVERQGPDGHHTGQVSRYGGSYRRIGPSAVGSAFPRRWQ